MPTEQQRHELQQVVSSQPMLLRLYLEDASRNWRVWKMNEYQQMSFVVGGRRQDSKGWLFALLLVLPLVIVAVERTMQTTYSLR